MGWEDELNQCFSLSGDDVNEVQAYLSVFVPPRRHHVLPQMLPTTPSITGYSASGGTVAATASVSQALVSTGEMLVTGTTVLVDSDGVKGASAGDVVAYEIELRNTGGTTLYQIFASDPLLDAQRLR